MADGGEKQIVVLLSAAPAPGDGKGKSAAQRRRSSGTVGTLTACLRSESGESHTVLWNTDALFEDSNNKRAGEHSKSAGKGSLLKGRLNHFPRVRDIQFMGKVNGEYSLTVELVMGKGHLYKGSGVVAADSSNSVSVKLAGTSASEGAWLVNLGFFPSEAEWHKQTLELREETVAIHLHDVKNIPSLDIMSPSDPYVVAYLSSDALTRSEIKKKVAKGSVGLKKRWQVVDDSFHVKWNSARNLGNLSDKQYLVLELWDEDPDADDLIGVGNISLSSLPSFSPTVDPVSALPHASVCFEAKKRLKHENCKGTVARVPLSATSPPPRKWLFFVRHGQSKWNKAQSDKDIGGMMGEVDHPLDTTGIEQVRALEERIQKLLSGDVTGYPEDEREYLEQLKGAGCVFVSPLTRAFQTCVIGVHPILKKVKDLYVIRAAKEKQNLGGRDTKGEEVGKDIVKKVRKCTAESLGEEAAARYVDCLDIDVSDVEKPWWSDVEKPIPFESRLEELMSKIQFNSYDAIVVVGHSHFFRAICQHFMHPDIARTPLGKELQEHVLINGGVIGVQLDFLQHEREIVTDVKLLLGTTLIGH